MHNLYKPAFWLSSSLIIADGLFFGLTNPVRVASILIIVGFALLLLSFYWVFYSLQKLIALYVPWLSRQKYLSLSAVVGAGAIVALQSVGQISARDFLLIPLAVVVLYAYTSYGKNSASP